MCRDSEGNYIGASTITFLEISDLSTLEALTVQEALSLADDLYEWRIYIASDCKTIVDDIKQRSAAVYGVIIWEIRVRSNLFTTCIFSHEFRTLNTEAHNLVKHLLHSVLVVMFG